MTRHAGSGVARTFAWPLALALLTLAALVAGLMGTGALDVVAVAGLSAPTALGVCKLARALSAPQPSRAAD